MTQISVALDARALLGECPRWHAKERRLYWVDILRNALLWFDPETGAEDARVFAQPIGCFAFTAGGGFVLGMKNGFALLPHWLAEPEPFGAQFLADQADLRLNDGRTDPHGRFWAGSVNMAKSAADAALYRLDGDGTLTEIAGGMTTCNGAAFDGSGNGPGHFHHTDTPSHAIRRYDYDSASGNISNQQIFHQFSHGHGRPDGGSFDAEGFYWSALYAGGRVVRLSPAGEIVAEVALPVSRPTMIAFGGDDLKTAYVTSARAGLSDEELAREPLAGAIFSFRVDVPGLPETDFALRG